MGLEKLIIKAEKNQAEDFADEIKVLFNPKNLAFAQKGARVENGQLIASNEPNRIKLDLFFDTTLPGTQHKNVQLYTRQIFNLTQPRIGAPQKRPPRCKLVWGKILGNGGVLMSDGFLTDVSKTLLQFLEDGTPVRATLNCTFEEWIDPIKGKKIENLINDPVRVVRRGETLSSIAAQEYGDPTLWRVIARENRLEDPQVVPGQVLTVPPLSSAVLSRR